MRFSIIVPIYNVEKYISQCVESLVKQCCSDKFEILLINDGSTDNSKKICDKLSEKYDNVFVFLKENGGLSDARNYGILKARGEYLIFVDGDDWINHDNLLLKASCLIKEKSFDYIIFGACKYVEDNKKYIYENQVDLTKITSNYDENLLYFIESQTYSMSACTKIMKKDFIIENNLFFKKGIYSEDLEWYLRVVQYAKSVYAIPGDYYVYRQRNNSITTSISEKNFVDNINILEEYALKEFNYKSDSFKLAYNGMLAYAYIMDILVYSKLESNLRKKYYSDLKRYKYLLKFSVNKRIKIVDICTKLFSLKFVVFMIPLSRKLKIYLKEKIK